MNVLCLVSPAVVSVLCLCLVNGNAARSGDTSLTPTSTCNPGAELDGILKT